jgi:hypothetical protein
MRETIPVTRPYDADWVLRFLGTRALPGIERVEAATWQRATLISGKPALLHVNVRARSLEVESPVPLDPPTRARLERLSTPAPTRAGSASRSSATCASDASSPAAQASASRVPGIRSRSPSAPSSASRSRSPRP